MSNSGRRHHYTKDEVLEAIKDSGGIVNTIARRLDCVWITAKRYTEKWAETRQALADEQETVLDMAESTLYQSIRDGDTQDAKWLLARKGKHRGFNERHEIDHSGSIHQTGDIDLSRLTDEELETLARLQRKAINVDGDGD